MQNKLNFDIVRKNEIKNTFRVSKVMGQIKNCRQKFESIEF